MPQAKRLLDQVTAFKYVTVENAPVYRALVQVFYEARRHYTIELRPAEVSARLEDSAYYAEIPDENALTRHLEQLVEWGNLSHRHDTAAVSRIEDFYRRSWVYSLSAVGEAAHRAVLEVEATVGRSGSLQATMLEKIRDTLQALAGGGEPALVMRLVHDLETAFETLTDEASRFIGDLDRAQESTHQDEVSFAAYKHAVLAYVSRFVDRLRGLAAEIAQGVAAVRKQGIDTLLAEAARSGDLPPLSDGGDPTPVWIAEKRSRFEGVADWFVSDGVRRPTVDHLADAAVGAVVDLTRILGRLNDQRLCPADRAADMRTLALWFEACEDEEQAHRLWHGAFGLYAPRHFHLVEEDPEVSSPNMSWWEARPVRVPVKLRARGRISRSGRAAAVPDHRRTREWLMRRQRRERQRRDTALRRFMERGPVRLSELRAVSQDELELLLDLLDECLWRPHSEDGSRSGPTSDGQLQITLRPPESLAPEAVLETPGGKLRCRNYLVEVRAAGRGRQAVAAHSQMNPEGTRERDRVAAEGGV